MCQKQFTKLSLNDVQHLVRQVEIDNNQMIKLLKNNSCHMMWDLTLKVSRLALKIILFLLCYQLQLNSTGSLLPQDINQGSIQRICKCCDLCAYKTQVHAQFGQWWQTSAWYCSSLWGEFMSPTLLQFPYAVCYINSIKLLII